MMIGVAVFTMMGIFGGSAFRLRLKELRIQLQEQRRLRELKAWNMRALSAERGEVS